MPQSKQLYREWIAELRDIGDLASLATSPMGYSVLFIMIGEPDQAEPLIEESVELHQKMSHLGTSPYYLNALGLTALLQSEYKQAQNVFEEAITVADTSGDPWSKAN